jgi:hypothetical protein
MSSTQSCAYIRLALRDTGFLSQSSGRAETKIVVILFYTCKHQSCSLKKCFSSTLLPFQEFDTHKTAIKQCFLQKPQNSNNTVKYIHFNFQITKQLNKAIPIKEQAMTITIN